VTFAGDAEKQALTISGYGRWPGLLEAGLARLVVMRKGGGGKVAINPDLVTHVRSAAGAFTDIFFDGQQVAVEGTFEEVVARLTGKDRRPEDGERREGEADRRGEGGGLVFGRLGR